jgi:hypothetical protein
VSFAASARHGCEKRLQAERQLADAGSNSNVLTLGDNAYFVAGSTLATPIAIENLETGYRQNLRDSGNHDYEGGDSNDYFGYFGAKTNPMASAPLLDDQTLDRVRAEQQHRCDSRFSSSTVAQAGWPAPQPCVAAAWHHARFTSARW